MFIGVLAGAQYSRTWTFDSTFLEALERFLRDISLGEKYYFWGTLKKVISMLLMTISLICSVILLRSTNHINEKHRVVNLVKHHSTG